MPREVVKTIFRYGPRPNPKSISQMVYRKTSLKREGWYRKEEAEKLIRGQRGSTDFSNSKKPPPSLGWQDAERRWYHQSPGVTITQQKTKSRQACPILAGDLRRGAAASGRCLPRQQGKEKTTLPFSPAPPID